MFNGVRVFAVEGSTMSNPVALDCARLRPGVSIDARMDGADYPVTGSSPSKRCLTRGVTRDGKVAAEGAARFTRSA